MQRTRKESREGEKKRHARAPTIVTGGDKNKPRGYRKENYQRDGDGRQTRLSKEHQASFFVFKSHIVLGQNGGGGGEEGGTRKKASTGAVNSLETGEKASKGKREGFREDLYARMGNTRGKVVKGFRMVAKNYGGLRNGGRATGGGQFVRRPPRRGRRGPRRILFIHQGSLY